RVRCKCVSQAPWLWATGACLIASPSCIPSLLNVAVTKVRLIDCSPTRDRAVFMAPIAKLITAILGPSDKKPQLRGTDNQGQQGCDHRENQTPYSMHRGMREQSSREGTAPEEHDRQRRIHCRPKSTLPDFITGLRCIPTHE